MKLVVPIALACGACGFQHGSLGLGGDGGGSDAIGQRDARVDAPPDGPPDAPPDASFCYGTGLVTVCFAAAPTGDYTVSTTAGLGTDSGCTTTKSQTGDGLPLCVLAYQTIHIDAELLVSGAAPLVLLATDTIEIGAGAELDAASYRLTGGGEQVGPGEASGGTLCGAPTTGGADAAASSAGGGGGAGGSFGGQGGDGAKGRDDAGGTAGTAAAAMPTVTFVRGGCAGTAGGAGAGFAGGASGHGGGAVYLIAGTSITVTGTISVSGEGGFPGTAAGNGGSGGGGGGGGGFIGLDSPSVVVAMAGAVYATGGGGGEGAGLNSPGNVGESGLPVDLGGGGGGGTGGFDNINGGDGGSGGAGVTLDGTAGSTDSNGGGAGGGSVGVIRVFPAQTLGGTVSPAAS